MNEDFITPDLANPEFTFSFGQREYPAAESNRIEIRGFSNTLDNPEGCSTTFGTAHEYVDPSYPDGEFTSLRSNWYPATPITHVVLDTSLVAALPNIIYTEDSRNKIKQSALGPSGLNTWFPSHVVNCAAQIVSIQPGFLDFSSVPSADFFLQAIFSVETPPAVIKKLKWAFFNQFEEFITQGAVLEAAWSAQRVDSEAAARDSVTHLGAIARAREHSRTDSPYEDFGTSSGLASACTTFSGHSSWRLQWRSLPSRSASASGVFVADFGPSIATMQDRVN